MTNNEIKKLIKEAKDLRRMGEELASSLSDIEEKIKAEHFKKILHFVRRVSV